MLTGQRTTIGNDFGESVEEQLLDGAEAELGPARPTLRVWLLQHSKHLIVSGLLGLVLGCIWVWTHPALHRSQATLMVLRPIELDRPDPEPDKTGTSLESRTALLITSTVMMERLVDRINGSADERPSPVKDEQIEHMEDRISAWPADHGVIELMVEDEDGARSLEVTATLIEELRSMRGEITRSRLLERASLIERIAERTAVAYRDQAAKGIELLKEMLSLTGNKEVNGMKDMNELADDLRSRINLNMVTMSTTEEVLLAGLREHSTITELLSGSGPEEIVVLKRPKLISRPAFLRSYLLPTLLFTAGAVCLALVFLVLWFQYAHEWDRVLDEQRPGP